MLIQKQELYNQNQVYQKRISQLKNKSTKKDQTLKEMQSKIDFISEKLSTSTKYIDELESQIKKTFENKQDTNKNNIDQKKKLIILNESYIHTIKQYHQ